MVDIFVPWRGGSAREVEERVTKPMERFINEIPGVEYIYPTSRPDFALVTVRYTVGEDMEEILVKLWTVLMKNMDRTPAGVSFPLIQTKSIDDVPVLALTLSSSVYDEFGLRRIGAELAGQIKKVENVSTVELTGGLRRRVRVVLDPVRLRAFHVDPLQIARQIRDIFDETPGVVDVHWLVEDDQETVALIVDKEKAALTGVSTEQVADALRMALSGSEVGLLHVPTEIEPVGIELRLAPDVRASVEDLGALSVQSRTGAMIPVSDLVTVQRRIEDQSIFRKNLKRVVYVTGDVAGEAESPLYALLDMDDRITEIETPDGTVIEPLYTTAPFLEEQIGVKWDGEWQITYEVFRDLELAFGVVLIIIYLLIIGWFQSFKVPLIMMVAIPLSLVGIVPGHGRTTPSSPRRR